LLGGIGIKCLELKKEICDYKKFEILSEELGKWRTFLVGCIIEKFINTINSIAKDLSIISSTEIKKSDVKNVSQNLLPSKGKT